MVTASILGGKSTPSYPNGQLFEGVSPFDYIRTYEGEMTSLVLPKTPTSIPHSDGAFI